MLGPLPVVFFFLFNLKVGRQLPFLLAAYTGCLKANLIIVPHQLFQLNAIQIKEKICIVNFWPAMPMFMKL